LVLNRNISPRPDIEYGEHVYGNAKIAAGILPSRQTGMAICNRFPVWHKKKMVFHCSSPLIKDLNLRPKLISALVY